MTSVRLRWALLLLSALFSPLFASLFGSAGLSPEVVWQCMTDTCPGSVEDMIFFDIRLPRVLGALLAGGALAIAGATLQNVTRNGLADPYLFGIVAGAGLGAAIVSVLPDIGWLPEGTSLPVAAFAGAWGSVFLVQGLAASRWARTPEQLLLAGIALSLMLGAATHMVLYIGEPFAANKVMFWMMGSLTRLETPHLLLIAVPLFFAVILLWLSGRRFDAMLLGDKTALSLGVHAGRMRMLGLIVCASLTAVVVAHCGGIGFVGLMIPHVVRRWFGVNTRAVILGSLLLGGVFLVWADVLARTLLESQELPIGIITSAIGSVFFLLMMRQRA